MILKNDFPVSRLDKNSKMQFLKFLNKRKNFIHHISRSSVFLTKKYSSKTVHFLIISSTMILSSFQLPQTDHRMTIICRAFQNIPIGMQRTVNS